MKAISIFNDVLGPVMRGPSSSHTAAPYQIGRMARALLLGPDRVPHLSRGTASEGERSEAGAARQARSRRTSPP